MSSCHESALRGTQNSMTSTEELVSFSMRAISHLDTSTTCLGNNA